MEGLLAKAREYLPEDKIGTVTEAYNFAAEAHRGQVRLSGEPFIEHPLHTARFLADLRLDANALAAALLHDVMEDCDIAYEELAERFGPEIAGLVDGVTKLTETELAADHDVPSSEASPVNGVARAESLRKLLQSMAEDVRVVLIKLSDRLHNMTTLSALPPERRIVVAHETLDVYAPLAHRLGIWELKWRLEDLALRHIDPEAFHRVSRLLNSRRAEREEYVERIREIMQSELDGAGIKAEVTGRPKSIFSIHKKTQAYAKQNREIGEIFDLFALRVVVGEIGDCYAALGVVHTKWRPLPGQFDDYVANPKDNLYQSLHTSVLCEDALPVEVQIRTDEMHRLAEYGVAAHWLYKGAKNADRPFEEKMTWLRQLLEWQRDISGAEEFVESFKTDVFQNQVFVYTPKGELKELPAGATPVDFAYRIHTDIGHRCIGAKVNGKLVPLDYQLQNGDTVQVLTSETVGGPSADWIDGNLSYVKTTSARASARQWFNRQERKVNIERGREIFERQVRRLNAAIDDGELAALMGYDGKDEFFATLGNGSVTTSQVVDALASQQVTPEESSEVYVPTLGPGSAVEVVGVGDLITTMARCCRPIHGDEIVGYLDRGRSVMVHRKDCPEIVTASETESLVPVNWGQTQTLYPVQIRVEAWNRVGLLRDITSLLAEERVNIANIESHKSDEYDDISLVSLTVYVNGIDQLSRVFGKLEGVEGGIAASRVKPLTSRTRASF